MSGRLTTHVLDTAKGLPAEGLIIDFFEITQGNRKLIKKLITNKDGRTDDQLLSPEEFFLGAFELVFHAGSYLATESENDGMINQGFYGLIPVQFNIFSKRNYHVPLLLSPFGYSTYLGS
jgi:5-hydroxyisourate hydrolase